jgi:starch phosphorylase
MDKKHILSSLNQFTHHHFGCMLSQATEQQAYRALCFYIKDILVQRNRQFAEDSKNKGRKQVYYMSMEFLIGTSLRNNLFNLGLEQTIGEIFDELGMDLQAVYTLEPDAGLGNGGLGRLAACYMDAMTGLSYPAIGFSIRYEFGIFRQKIIDGWQMEFPDDWLNMGDVWLKAREDDALEVRFGGEVREWTDEQGHFHADHIQYTPVMAVPNDLYLSGYDTQAVNKLVLWSAKSTTALDMTAFSRGEYAKALESNTMAEVISKILYPADNHEGGKKLRLKQQYLLVSASLQSILKTHYKQYGTLLNLADLAAIHINDTHPALCVPELMRLLMDEYGFGWDEAWNTTKKTVTYTNHTVMSEALERWNEHMFRALLPRVYAIICEINRRLITHLHFRYPGDVAKIDYMSVIANGEIRMANLCLSACHTINGVSKLHSDILKNGLFHDYYTMTPQRFTNVTNGIAYRRWLCQANPALTSYLTDLIGDGFKKDSRELTKLLHFSHHPEVLHGLLDIKHQNKQRLAQWIARVNGIHVNPHSLFDVQIKRLHEYKRQLMNALHILYLYNQYKHNPHMHMVPRTFLFAAKAPPGYSMAKQIIRLIYAISGFIAADPAVRDTLKVVFVEDYKVSLAERIIPAADISQQISVAGKEASGTGNMKLMINGAVTLGTLDGANVEILEQVEKGYDPRQYYEANPGIKEVLDMLTSGILGVKFDDIVQSLLTNRYGAADGYMILADFKDYARAQQDAGNAFEDTLRFADMSLVNIAKAGVFSADRAVQEYADTIWSLRK